MFPLRDAGLYETDIAAAAIPRRADTVRSPERAEPVAGRPAGWPQAWGQKPRGLATARAGPAGAHKPDYAGRLLPTETWFLSTL